MNKRAIVCGVHPWGGAFRLGAHHLATALARAGFEVLYLAAPLSSAHIAAFPLSASVRARWAEWATPPKPQGVRVVTPLTWRPLSASWGADSARNLTNWAHDTMPSLQGILRTNGFERPDLVLIDGPLQLAAARLAQPRRLVMRMFDRFTHMPGVTPALLDLAGEAAREADLVVYSAHALEADAAALGAKRLLFLPNGVDAAHFAAPRPAPAAYAAIPRPRAVYVGQTGPLFDAQLVARVAEQQPQTHFVIIGPSAPLSSLRGLSNVHLLGTVDWQDMPAYLQYADVGLAPFAVERFPDYAAAVNPLKIYEYLAARLPVVATRWAELEKLQAPGLHLAASAEFGAMLQQVIATPTDPAPLKAYAAAASWDERVARLLAALD